MESPVIDPISALIRPEEPAVEAAKELGKDEFLNLLVAKLSNQDPLNPTQDTEFVAELATFSSLEQLVNVNDNLQALSLGQANLINAQVLDLIGKEALIESDLGLTVKDGKPEMLVYAVPQSARHVTLTVFDQEGNEKTTIELDPNPRGRVNFEWDGMIGDERIEDGEYTIKVDAVGLDGKPMAIGLFRSLPIDGVGFDAGMISLISGDFELPYESILEIRSGRS